MALESDALSQPPEQAPLSFQTFALLWVGFGVWFVGSFLMHLIAYPERADVRNLLGHYALMAAAVLVITALFPLLTPLSAMVVLLAFIIMHLIFDTRRHRLYEASQANIATNEG